jgi:hypothetical protein
MAAEPTSTDNEQDESDPPVMLASEPVSFAPPPCGLYGEVARPKPN